MSSRFEARIVALATVLAIVAACARTGSTSAGAATAPAAAPAASAAAASSAADGNSCVAERAAAQQRADSVLAVPALLWRPSATDDTARIARARHSGVVAQVLIDTAGAPVMKTFRVVSADYPQFGEPASRMLEPMRFPVATSNGCTVPSVLLIPFEFQLR